MTATQMEEVAVEDPLWRRANRESRPGGFRFCLLAGMVVASFGHPFAARAQVPQWVTPTVEEMGIGSYTAPTSSSGSGGSSSTGTSGGTGSSTSSDALDTMMATSWGAEAAQNAASLGMNASSVAAMCLVESGCNSDAQNGSFTGAFQMGSAAFQDGLATALAADPSLASQVVQGAAGIDDPATVSIAAEGYMLQAASALQQDGVSSPSALDARAYYNFGPTAGGQIASASGSDLMSNYLSAAAMTGNAIFPTETVAQWQAGVAAKMGTAANQPILGSA